MILELRRESRVPLYLQIATQVREMITRGTLKVGDRLPPNRELAEILGVNRTTVTTAYAELEADGIINSHVGRGTFVKAVPAASKKAAKEERAKPSILWSALLADHKPDVWLNALLDSAQRKDTISLAYGLPQADLFPLDDFRRSVDRVIRREGRTLLQLGMASGYTPLREFLASHMAASAVMVKPDEVLITNGCQQSLDLIRRVLVGEGDEVVIENPTYPGAISVFCGNNAKYITVPVGGSGMDLNALEEILSRRRPKLIYTIPTYHNPTGATMNVQSRRRLIELAVKYRVPIVEDDIYTELRYDGPMLPSLKALDEYGLVISINSFSKVGFPGLRVGWVVAPRIVIDHLNAAKQNCDMHASLLTQAAIYEFSKHGLLAKHIKRVRKAYGRQRDAMLEALEKYFPKETTWSKPDGGMMVWVSLPPALKAGEILLLAAEQGVVFSPGEYFYSSSPQQNFMRLCFTMATPRAIEEAIKRLGSIIKERIAGLRKQHATRKAEAYRALV